MTYEEAFAWMIKANRKKYKEEEIIFEYNSIDESDFTSPEDVRWTKVTVDTEYSSLILDLNFSETYSDTSVREYYPPDKKRYSQVNITCKDYTNDLEDLMQRYGDLEEEYNNYKRQCVEDVADLINWYERLDEPGPDPDEVYNLDTLNDMMNDFGAYSPTFIRNINYQYPGKHGFDNYGFFFTVSVDKFFTNDYGTPFVTYTVKKYKTTQYGNFPVYEEISPSEKQLSITKTSYISDEFIRRNPVEWDSIEFLSQSQSGVWINHEWYVL